jgi:hypothetical protein
VIVYRGRAIHEALGRVVDRVLDATPELAASASGTLVVGTEDPLIPGADAEAPLVVVPALGPRRTSSWAAALVAEGDAVVLLDACEIADLPEALTDRPVLVAGLPAPRGEPDGCGVDVGTAASPELAAALRDRTGDVARGPGVAWVGGRGASPLAAALEAWAAGRAVVSLPGTPAHEFLGRGGALRAETDLEALEATAFLTENAPLARALGRRGRTVASAQPSAREVGLRFLEGAELARASLAAAPR